MFRRLLPLWGIAAACTAGGPDLSERPERAPTEALWLVNGHDLRDLANLAPGVEPCDNVGPDKWTEDGCYNLQLPPRPSTMRSLVNHWYSWGTSQRNVRSFDFFSPQNLDGGQTFLFGTRSSLDGRLHVTKYGKEPALSPIYLENLGYGFQTLEDRLATDAFDVNFLINQTIDDTDVGFVHYWMIRGGSSRNDVFTKGASIPQDRMYGENGGTDLCSRGEDSLPYPCRARNQPSDPWLDGLCYDISTVHSFGWEIRSNQLTVFLEKGDDIPAPTVSAPPPRRKVWIYPTAGVEHFGQVVDGVRELPPWSEFNAKAFHASTKAKLGGTVWDAAVAMANSSDCANYQTDPTAPRWCWYFDRMEHSPAAMELNGTPFTGKFKTIELSTTGDGHVLVGHEIMSPDVKLFYAYSPRPCDASGWTSLQPISNAATDPDVHGRYGFAEYPLIAPDGASIPTGSVVAGAYPWIDRRGANVFFGTDVAPYGWIECSDPTPAGSLDCAGTELPTSQINEKNDKMPKVAGLWTRGKVVHIDGVLNGVDHTDQAEPDRGELFYLSLFDQQPWEAVRPGNNSDFFSLENVVAHIDTLTPMLPAEVVWNVTPHGVKFGNAAIGEVAFDDYLFTGARIVAPMNARLQALHTNPTDPSSALTWWQNNGMSLNPTKPNESEGELFEGTGIYLQNNAPLGSDLPELELRGGAFVAPASTGVIGKGVYLDGLNDRIEIGNLGTLDNFYLGLWLEPGDDEWRTLATFADGTRLTTWWGALRVVLPDGTPSNGCTAGATHHIWGIPNFSPGRWTHIGLAVRAWGTKVKVQVYADGTALASQIVDVAPGAWLDDAFRIGTDEDYCMDVGYTTIENQPVRGWVDELKLFEIGPGELGTNHLHEVACNRALGSLDTELHCEQIPFRQSEVLDAKGVGSGLEFPKAAYEATPGGDNCGLQVHRNRDHDCFRATALQDPPRDPALGRPDQQGNAFCKGCHTENGAQSDALTHPMQRYDLSWDALTPGFGPATHDLRRQPMQWAGLHDEDLWNGWSHVRLIDPKSMEYCDDQDNDDDNVVDNGCDACSSVQRSWEELGRIAMWSGKANLYRDHDGVWNPRGRTDGFTTSSRTIFGHCRREFADVGDVLGAVELDGSLPDAVRTRDLKPFVNAAGLLYPGRGKAEWVCCGERDAAPVQQVPVDADLVRDMAWAPVSMTVGCDGGGLGGPGSTSCDRFSTVTVDCLHPTVYDLTVIRGTQAETSFGTCDASGCSGALSATGDRLTVQCHYCADGSGDPC